VKVSIRGVRTHDSLGAGGVFLFKVIGKGEASENRPNLVGRIAFSFSYMVANGGK